MPKTLFICHGNVGRSQMAEGFYNHFTYSNDASSAGTNVETPKKYPRLPQEIITIMSEKGIDISNQKVKLVTEEAVKTCDRIYIMCEREKCPQFLLDSDKIIFWDVKDPHYMTLDEMRIIRNTIEQKVLSVI